MPNAVTPLVSVVVPAWNAERTISETLRSVSAQTYANLEIIIVDDGSTDDTAALASAYCEVEPRARLVRKENGGVASARNRGIEEAQGAWIAPIDADDLWHPTKIAKQVAASKVSPPPGLVYCWYQSIDVDGVVVGSGPDWKIGGRAWKQLAYCNPVENGSALLLSREALLDVGGYEPGLRARDAEGCEDVLIQLQIARRYPIAFVPEYLVGYRKTPTGMSRDTGQIIRSWRLVHEQLAATGTKIPRRVKRWNEAFFDKVLASRSIASRDYATAVRLLAKALWKDPLRWASYFAYRAIRTAARLLRGRRAPSSRLPFGQVDPRSAVVADPDELTFLKSLLVRLELARLRRLAVEDAEPPASAGSGSRRG